MKHSKINIIKFFGCLVLFIIAAVMMPSTLAKAADDAKTVSVGIIDYDSLTMEILSNKNTTLYYSTDKTNWYEVSGHANAASTGYYMDISWVSQNSEVTIYLKGDTDTTVNSVTLAARDTGLKVTFDKIEEDFSFENCDDASYFQWKKATDYTWHTVLLDTSSASYRSFLSTVQGFLVKGAKLTIRIPQTIGRSESVVGNRPSKEVIVTLTKRANAPSVSVNASKMMLNTSEKMEYYNASTNQWIECDSKMTVEDIAPAALFKNGAKTVSIKIRTAATSSKSYSKTATIKIPGQGAAPTIGGTTSDVSYYYQNKKIVLVFNNASATNVYSYAIVKPGDEFDVTKASFTQIKNSKPKMLSQSTVPDGSTIYIRRQGINANASKYIELKLSSETSTINVSYPQ